MRTLTGTWHVRSTTDVFGHQVRIHQNGSAVILEVDGLCFVGDAVDDQLGRPAIQIPRLMALFSSVEDAKRAVELAWQMAKGQFN